MHRTATKKGRAGSSPRPAPMHEARPVNTPGEMTEMACSSMTPEIISWGKLNRGQSFLITAHDMARAIRLARLSPNQNIVLGEYLEASWGESNRLQGKRDGQWADPLPAKINMSLLAEQLGLPRQSLSDAKRELITSKILIEDAEGWVLVNKRADEWVHHATGQSRLTPEFILHCRRVQPNPPAEVQSEFGFARVRTNPRARHQTTAMPGQVGLDSSRQQPRVARAIAPASPAPLAARPCAASPSPVAPPTLHTSPAPIEERARVLDPGELNRVGEREAPHPDSALGGRKTPDGPTHGAVDEARRMIAEFESPPGPARPAGAGGTPRPVNQANVDRFHAMMARRPSYSPPPGVGGAEPAPTNESPPPSQASVDRFRALMASGFRFSTRPGGGGA